MAAKKKPAAKKAANKKKTNPIPPNGMWFEKSLVEGPGSDPIGRKRKLIEAFYLGYLHYCNENDGSSTQYNILDDPDGFFWRVRMGIQHVKGYIMKANVTS